MVSAITARQALQARPDPAISRAALYVRRSHRDAGESDRNGRSLQEQEAETRALAASLGLDVVEVYAEREGTGASSRSRKRRPVWERALADLEDGSRFRTLVVWALDRADRRGAVEIGRLLDAHADGSRRVVAVDGTDTGDSRRRLEIILRAEIARDESERNASRVERSKRSARDAGRWLGGPAPFGLQVVAGRVEPDPETAPLARRIAEEALAGRTLHAIARDLNEEGVPSPFAGRTRTRPDGTEVVLSGSWRHSTLRQILRAPAFAGLQSSRRRTASGGWAATAEVYRNEAGEPVSIGTGIVTPGERARLLRLLDERTSSTGGTRKDGEVRRTGRKRSRSALGGLVRCASCGAPGNQGGSSRHRSFRCSEISNAPGSCAGFSAPVVATVEAVSDAFLRRLAALEAGDPLLLAVAERWTARQDPESVEARAEAEAAVEDARAALKRLQDLAVAGVLTPEEAAERAPEARRRVALAERRLQEAGGGALLDVSPLLDTVLSREGWADLDDEERRDLLGLAVERVEVSRAGGRGRRFVPAERLRIHWTDGTVSAPA